MPLQTHAAVAKAGVDALSASVALEYGPRGVTSNILTPGPSACFLLLLPFPLPRLLELAHQHQNPS